MLLFRILIGIMFLLVISNPLTIIAVNQTTLLSNQAKSVIASSNKTDNKLIVLSDLIKNRIDKAAAILEVTSRLPEMRGQPQLELFSPASKGIPENADLEKRQVGREILSKYPEDFVSFLFLTPNGTVYLLEPFTRQQNLSTYDLSHRDYYKGVTQTNHTFIGNMITSVSSGRNQIQLAVPVFSLGDSNQTASLIGVLSSGLNFETFNEILQSLNLSSHERIVLLDSNGTKIADSDTKQISSLHKSNIGDASFRNLQSFNNALKGETGTVQEMVNGINTQIKYKPVKAIQNNWVLLLFQSSGVSTVPANSNLGHAENTTVSIPFNGTMLNSNITNKSSNANTTMPEQVPPQSVNGSKVGKI
jgi:hypothetical protein